MSGEPATRVDVHRALSSRAGAPPAEQRAADAAALLREADAVLLDYNGTLSLDEDLLEACYAEALVRLGLPALGAGEYDGLIGLSERDIAGVLLRARGRGPEQSDALLTELAVAYAEGFRRESRIPGSHRAVVEELHARAIPLAVVTGTLEAMVVPVLQAEGLLPLLDAVVTIDDVGAGKPDPEGFLLALARLGVQPSRRVVVCEDSDAGVQAAESAGLSAIVVGDGRVSTPAEGRVDSLAAVLTHL